MCVCLSYPGDRSHVIERHINARTGERAENQEFVNLDDSEGLCTLIVDLNEMCLATPSVLTLSLTA